MQERIREILDLSHCRGALRRLTMTVALLAFVGVVPLLAALRGRVLAGEQFEIPVTVHEALQGEVEGIDRQAEPVTLGIPFPRDVKLEELGGRPALGLVGAKAYQFRTLTMWRGGGGGALGTGGFPDGLSCRHDDYTRQGDTGRWCLQR